MNKLLDREPTPEMVGAVFPDTVFLSDARVADIWRDMHDAAPDLGQGEAVGAASFSTEGFTGAIFHAAEVPLGTKLYTHPQPDQSAADEIKRLRTALRFYANGEHYHLDEGEKFDSVSGEPDNWLCGGVEDSQTMIETGQVAAAALRGVLVDWVDGGEDETPQPIAGEVSCLDQGMPQPDQSARIKELEEALRGIRGNTAHYFNSTLFPSATLKLVDAIARKALSMPERTD